MEKFFLKKTQVGPEQRDHYKKGKQKLENKAIGRD